MMVGIDGRCVEVGNEWQGVGVRWQEWEGEREMTGAGGRGKDEAVLLPSCLPSKLSLNVPKHCYR